jgi:NO-binding membrane sensor protein with MHYT domain
MTVLRPTISLPTHAALELPVGVLALIAPFPLGFELAGAVLSVLLGVAVVGLALDAAQRPAQISAHQAFDYGIAFAAVLVAVPLALAGDAAAALFLGAAGVALLALDGATRYSLRAS